MIVVHSFIYILDLGKGGDDKSVLLQFKTSVLDPEGVLSGWNHGGGGLVDHCSWYGVTCDSKSRVLMLNITGGGGGGGGKNSETHSCYSQLKIYGFGIRRNCVGKGGKLMGNLSPLIGELTELRVLSLPFHEFNGGIPDEIWGLEKLEVVDLEGNLFSGVLNIKVGGLKRLRVFNLGFNRIVGEIHVAEIGGGREEEDD